MRPDSELQRRVVLGVDDSEHSERAFDWYVNNISDNVKDILLIIHAQEIPTHSAAPYASYDYWYYEEWQQSLEKVAKNSRALLEAYGKKCRERGINYKLYNERSNSPGEVICKLAADEKAHLLVVGARGVGKIQRKFFGSTQKLEPPPKTPHPQFWNEKGYPVYEQLTPGWDCTEISQIGELNTFPLNMMVRLIENGDKKKPFASTLTEP